MRRILIAGGGTAGHVFPAVAVARRLARVHEDVEPVFVGTEDRLEGTLVPRAGFRLHHIDALPLPRRLTVGLLRVPGALRRSARRCREIIREEQAVAAVTFGGYVSFPLDWACSRTALPLVLHEQNSVPGLANRFAARWADGVAVTFPGSVDSFPHPERIAVTGNPVREQILEVGDLDPGEARAHFDLEPDRVTVLAFGGSQGARSINEAVVASHDRWADPERLQILHAAGEQLHADAVAGWERQRERGPGPLVRCLDFVDDMARAYAAADVVERRAGATSLAEITAVGLPALLVPYPHATRDHQLRNARALERVGAARAVPDDELTAETLVAALEPWVTDPRERSTVAAVSRAFGRRDAADNVVHLLDEVLATTGVMT